LLICLGERPRPQRRNWLDQGFRQPRLTQTERPGRGG
jgi:hypothetical protein